MKIVLSFKTPDVVTSAIDEALDGVDDDEAELAREQAKEAAEKFVKYGECAHIEIDTIEGTATVLEN